MSCHISYVTQWGQVSRINSTVQHAFCVHENIVMCTSEMHLL